MINNNYGTENSNIPHSAEIDIIGLRREEYQGTFNRRWIW